MILKGFHYKFDCDGPGCDEAHVIEARRHNPIQRRQAKHTGINLGWEFKPGAITFCPGCVKKRDERNARIIADNIKESVKNGGPETPAENLEGVEL